MRTSQLGSRNVFDSKDQMFCQELTGRLTLKERFLISITISRFLNESDDPCKTRQLCIDRNTHSWLFVTDFAEMIYTLARSLERAKPCARCQPRCRRSSSTALAAIYRTHHEQQERNTSGEQSLRPHGRSFLVSMRGNEADIIRQASAHRRDAGPGLHRRNRH
jgi:hypothetical protein